MIIYLEGPDGSGKSTLINNIVDKLNKSMKLGFACSGAEARIVTHPWRPDRISEKELYTQLKEMARDNNHCYIIDRGPISDIIYRVFDDQTTVTTTTKLLKFMKEFRTKILTIYCRTDVAEQKMLERGDENPIALTRHKEITKVYDIFMSMLKEATPYSVVNYDFTNKKSINTVMANITIFCDMNYYSEV